LRIHGEQIRRALGAVRLIDQAVDVKRAEERAGAVIGNYDHPIAPRSNEHMIYSWN
jgi:hypothetical protein